MVYKRSCCYFRYAHPQVTVALRIASMQTIVDIRTMSSLHRYTSPKIQCKIIFALCILKNWVGLNCLNPESLFCWNGFHKKLLNSTHDRLGVHSVAYRDSVTGCWPLFCLCSNYTVVVTYKQVKRLRWFTPFRWDVRSQSLNFSSKSTVRRHRNLVWAIPRLSNVNDIATRSEYSLIL